MKRWLIVMLMLMCLCFQVCAEGLYRADIDGKQVTLAFKAGPFGPVEMGTAELSIDGKSQRYEYQMTETNNVMFYDIYELCTLIGDDNKLSAFIPLNVVFSKNFDGDCD